jgi:hypothetical protein
MKASLLLLLSLGIIWGFLLLQSCMQSNHNEENSGSISNIPSGHYISPLECRPCHQAITDSFLLTGKGRSLFPVQESEVLCNWSSPRAVYDAARNLHYLPRKEAGRFYICEFRLENGDTIHWRREEVSQAIGSGNQTVSFLWSENGYLYEMPLTWYRKKKIWDLSPGYENGNNHGFDRAIGSECLDCHASGFEAVPQSGNRYRKPGMALSCEACHGDVSDHLRKMKEGRNSDPEVLRLARLSGEIQMDVCRQCHLEGIKIPRDHSPAGKFVPGKRFADYHEVFISNSGNGEFGFASHAERLQMSSCYRKSSGKMNCSSCHNPHERIPGNRLDFFNRKCESCHSSDSHGKGCPAHPEKTNCIGCHLQSGGTSDIPHVQSTDHWIRKNPAKEKTLPVRSELQNFAGKNYSRREIAQAWLYLAETRGDSLSFARTEELLPYLPPASRLHYHYLKNLPGLPDADSSGFGKSEDALLVFRWAEVKRRAGLSWYSTLARACKLAPDRLDFLYARILAEEESGKAASYPELLKRRPLHPEANSNLAFEALQQSRFAEAEELLKKALKGNPDKILARENLARCYAESGRFSEARKELLRLIKARPEEKRYSEILSSLP